MRTRKDGFVPSERDTNNPRDVPIRLPCNARKKSDGREGETAMRDNDAALQQAAVKKRRWQCSTCRVAIPANSKPLKCSSCKPFGHRPNLYRGSIGKMRASGYFRIGKWRAT